MADAKQLAPHPDENLLSAFAEHTLTEKECQSVLEHLSTCTRCRDVVFLAQQAFSETVEHSGEIHSSALGGRSRMWWWSLAAIGALAALLVAIPVIVHRSRSNGLVVREIVPESKVQAPPASSPIASANSAMQVAPAETPARQRARSVPPGAALNRIVESHPEIVGSVVDRSGAVISGAQVTVRSPAIGETRTVVTDAQGHFDVAALQPGEYQVEVSAPGFNTLRQPLTIQQSERASLDARLDVGAASQTVTVSAGSIGGLTTDSVSVNGKIAEPDKTALPMNGRSAAPANLASTPPSQTSPAPTFAPGPVQQAVGGPLPSTQVINGALTVMTFPVKDGVVQRCTATLCVARNLPSGVKAVSTAASTRTVIALDADGNVFVSADQGEHWEQAKMQWSSKAVSLRTVPDHPQGQGFLLASPPAADAVQATHGTPAKKNTASPVIHAIFELANDKGQVWVSTDEGKTWIAK